jgi:hypothetical protein
MFPRMEIKNELNARDFGALGNGQTHPLRWSFETLPLAQEKYPHALSLDDELDWAAIQLAFYSARDYVRNTLARGEGAGIHRTGTSFAPPVFIPPGRFMINRPIKVYPHCSAYGCDWGGSQLQWVSGKEAPEPMATNPQGIMFVGPTLKRSCILWLQGDEEWPAGSKLQVAGMVNSIRGLGFKTHEGPGIYIGSNQNQLTIRDCWFNGYGDGPTGLGIVANVRDSSQQTSNLFLHHCQMEGCAAAVVLDRVAIGEIHNLQIDSCGAGIYVGSTKSASINQNKITALLPNPAQPFLYGIHVGCAISTSISNNIIEDVQRSAIKVLGRAVNITGNTITGAGGGLKPGWAIHVVGTSQQFGGNVKELRNQNGPYTIENNTFDQPGSATPVLLDADPGQPILV